MEHIPVCMERWGHACLPGQTQPLQVQGRCPQGPGLTFGLGPSTWRDRTHSPERLLQVVLHSDPMGMERVCVPRKTGPSLVLHSRVHTGTLHPDSFGFTGPATKGREAATDVRRRQACSGGSRQAVWAVHVPLLLGGSWGGGHLLWEHRGWNKHGGCPHHPAPPHPTPHHPTPPSPCTPQTPLPSAISDPPRELNKTCWSGHQKPRGSRWLCPQDPSSPSL